MSITDKKIAVIGLGYVGLPLTLAFAKKYSTVGFDVNSKEFLNSTAERISQKKSTPMN